MAPYYETTRTEKRSLREMVAAFVETDADGAPVLNKAARTALAEKILLRWAGAEGNRENFLRIFGFFVDMGGFCGTMAVIMKSWLGQFRTECLAWLAWCRGGGTSAFVEVRERGDGYDVLVAGGWLAVYLVFALPLDALSCVEDTWYACMWEFAFMMALFIAVIFCVRFCFGLKKPPITFRLLLGMAWRVLLACFVYILFVAFHKEAYEQAQKFGAMATYAVTPLAVIIYYALLFFLGKDKIHEIKAWIFAKGNLANAKDNRYE